MSANTAIQWTDVTWNIARGCTKVDADCKFCYMYRDSMSGTRFDPKQVVRTKTVFNLPLKIKEPSKIFASSLTDFFHEQIDSYRMEAWEIIRKCPQHTFQILTKRPERIMDNLPPFWDEIRSRVWMGTSVGHPDAIGRMEKLACAPIGCLKFLSLEPLHGPVGLDVNIFTSIFNNSKLLWHFQWVIVGGESGNENGKYRYRPCEIHWIENVVQQCRDNDVKVFVKQMGTYLAKALEMSDRHGSKMEEFPENLRIREFPNNDDKK